MKTTAYTLIALILNIAAVTAYAQSYPANTPEEFSKLLREEVSKWAEVVKVSGAKVD